MFFIKRKSFNYQKYTNDNSFAFLSILEIN